MEIFVEKVLERDMDFLIIREFITNRQFADLFLSQLDLTESTITGIAHSVMDNELGESDIIVYLLSGGKRIAIMIEDKVDALQQDRQAERYHARGHKMMTTGKIDKYFVFMTAPEAYLTCVVEYERTVSFEQMLNAINDPLNIAIINRAIQENKEGYVPIRHEGVTTFWEDFYKLIDTDFPHLSSKISRISTDRGVRAAWPGFSTWDKNMKIQYKSNKGFVDLQLNRLGERYPNVISFINTHFPDHDFEVVKTGKSVSLRLIVPVVDFKQEFTVQRQAVIDALLAVSAMEDLASKLPIYDLIG